MSINWTRVDEEYVSTVGLVAKDGETWVALVKEGFGLRICGEGFTKVRNAMTAVEEASKSKEIILPPIQFPAHIFS